MTSSNLIVIVTTVLMSAFAQILLKIGAVRIPVDRFTGVNFDSFIAMISVLFSKYIFIGMLIYVLSAGMWIWVLTKVDISLAYPFISLSFVITLGFGVTLFHEPLTLMKVLGTSLIMIGCVVIAKS